MIQRNGELVPGRLEALTLKVEYVKALSFRTNLVIPSGGKMDREISCDVGGRDRRRPAILGANLYPNAGDSRAVLIYSPAGDSHLSTRGNAREGDREQKVGGGTKVHPEFPTTYRITCRMKPCSPKLPVLRAEVLNLPARYAVP